MDMEWLKFGFQVLQFIVTGALAVYVYMSNKDKVTNDRIGKLEDDIREDIGGHGERIAKLEEVTRVAPTHGDLGDIHARINEVATGMNKLTGEFAGVKTVLNVIHQHLMNGGQK